MTAWHSLAYQPHIRSAHSVTGFCDRTKIPLATDGAQSDDTILFTCVSCYGLLRFVDPDAKTDEILTGS